MSFVTWNGAGVTEAPEWAGRPWPFTGLTLRVWQEASKRYRWRVENKIGVSLFHGFRRSIGSAKEAAEEALNMATFCEAHKISTEGIELPKAERVRDQTGREKKAKKEVDAGA